MDPFEQMVELKLQEAEESGLLSDLPGAGKPLPPDDLADVPAELRGAYRMLRHAGCIPEELELRRSNARLQDLIEAATDDGERERLRKQLSAQSLRYDLLMERRGRTAATDAYRSQVMRRLG